MADKAEHFQLRLPRPKSWKLKNMTKEESSQVFNLFILIGRGHTGSGAVPSFSRKNKSN